MISLNDLLNLWNTFFFTTEPPIMVNLFRIAFGLVLLLNGLQLYRHRLIWYGKLGTFPAAVHQKTYGRGRLSLLNWLPPDDESARWVIVAHLVAVLFLIIGLFSRVSVIVVWLTLVSLHHRHPYILNGGDHAQRLFTFLLIFAPVGGAWALDVLIFGAVENAAVWSLRLMQILVAVIYLKSVYWKLRGETWRDGTAAYYALNIADFQRVRLGWVAESGFLVAVITYLTILVELALGTLIWVREFRVPVVISGMLLHLGIELLMNVNLFGWTMIVGLMLFLPI